MNIKNRENKLFSVYKLQSPSGKIYIGISIDVEKRYQQHQKPEWRYNKILYRAICKYGWENFSKEIVAENLNRQQACEMEINLIRYYNSKLPYGYNITSGGELGPECRSDETKKKLSKIVKEMWNTEYYRSIVTSKRIKKIKSAASKQAWKEGINDNKMSRILCIETGKVYKSKKSAEKVVGGRIDQSLYSGSKNSITGHHYKTITEEEYLNIKTPCPRNKLSKEEAIVACKERHRRYYERDKEKINKRNKDWWDKHKEEMKEYNKNRRIKMRQIYLDSLKNKKCELCGGEENLCWCRPGADRSKGKIKCASDMKTPRRFYEFILGAVIWCNKCKRRHYKNA